jgi:CRP/FNR family transcriptional regulator, cyclic AMP receptor protein
MPESYSSLEIAQQLLTPHSLVSLSVEDAKIIASYMAVAEFTQDTIIFEANQSRAKSDYMLLVMQGDVLIEALTTGDGSAVVDVVGAGHLIGEMSLLDGAARSATCTAKTEVTVATLSRIDFERIIEDAPRLATRFLIAIAKRMADRLRLSNQKNLLLQQVNDSMQEELRAFHRLSARRFLSK